jgi:hypothetical protein
MKVFIAGGTGAIGRAIVSLLKKRGDEVVVLTRSREKAEALWPVGHIQIAVGDPAYEADTSTPWQASIAGCDAVINLAGEALDAERWTARFRQKIHDSRVDSTRFIAEAICKLAPEQRPSTLLNASGVDYYGFAELQNFDDDEVSEDEPGGESFLAGLCWDWEEETKICHACEVRVALLRTGFVLSKQGALAKLAAPHRLGLGGKLGSGRQWVSWIHIEDVARAYVHLLDSELSGPVNAVAPGAVRNAELAKAIAEVLGHHAWLPVPAFAMFAAVGPLAEYILKGRRVVPAALLADGFEFRFPTLRPALVDLLKSGAAAA